jgi:hypothetical protein
MILVGGRLDSRLINAPRRAITFFYAYGLLQTLFPFKGAAMAT